ncbi:C4-dicarboxylate ABC transporter [Fusobacterium necrophorum subsp. funduliforme]|uniref:TRAP transporter, DctM subunit n=2 Tax=Fusobacterium necrophorum TaxID=859 RepID=A0AAN4AS68_9FUSO|nr:TRAP transporter large permease [Fusobacterium necrophorum]AYV94192.1 TRAP transporter large permease [Fusobacterium necrophorum subsp. funduliforme]EFS22712.1 TRAP transporter, DctM subunit [Fusobacterium necrophorum D12]EJU15523.1 TRAP transporter, DctM subunit [Fusobacterium necrophorum subsp. funduliforme Fnf 1007]KYL01344.1 C4-dicarboxylate ABC transporter [Fusobacterium necrophorum subsp. funduliforme]KYL02358.1 C4-dicarboxylate ABC transporter [Fusobacterium necrophorum subsp. fundul
MEAFLPVIVLFVLFFLNIPIGFALMGSALFYFMFLNTTMAMNMVIQQFVTAVESFPYLAVPFFIMVGSVMNYSGISEELMNMAEVLAGHMKGGLAQVNCLLSAMMGGISGSANADAAMESKILVPEMIKKGFSKPFSAAVTAASSAVSPVIPPGTNLILYALIANVPVGDMFLAGYTPGILMTLAMMITVHIISVKRGYQPSRERMASPSEIGKQAVKSVWALAIPFGIILGMRIGMFTPTEAGGVAVFFCFVVGFFVYKKLKLHHIPIILMETVKSTGAVMIIIASAKVFGYYMTLERIPQMITEGLMNFTNSPVILLMVINLLLLFVGMFIEGGAALVILAPLLVPAVKALGVDPLHFGVIFIVNIMIGGLTPPFGSMMFTVCSIVDVKLEEFIREVWPFILSLAIVLLLVTYSSTVALFIPNLFR